MDLAMGAMSSLLPKLVELAKKEYNLQTSVTSDVESFSRELASMRAALQRVAEVPRDQLEEEVKLWAGDVRELSYDMEDAVDSLLVRVKGPGHGADTDGFKELVSKMKNLFTKGKARHQIATAIKEIKEQVQDVATRHERYKADGVFANLAAASRTTTGVDPLLVALFEDKQRIVGIANARDELIQKLRVGDASKQPKILSIVGFGGLGKTTLAKAVYDELRSKFDCTAFVSVSRSPDLRKVFKELLFEVDKEKYMSLSGATLNEKQLIGQLQESLGTKRYFIVIDDIWDVNAWKTIRMALMASKYGSRIITTTRNISVSKECCSSNDEMVYNMKPLTDEDSQRLFFNRIFPRDNVCPSELKQVLMDILKKCAGVPLAIITLASYLASNQKIKPKSQWYDLLHSIGRGLTNVDTNLEEMKRILSFSYYDLPSHLRACLLYLSIYPEDYNIDRDQLIRRWIAEGIIQGENLFELGENYFNELINRSMIQPVKIDVEGRVESCSVHDMMLDLICHLSNEENFVTIFGAPKENTPFERKVRRLSLQKSMEELTSTQLATTRMSQVRSLTVFSPAIDQMLPLSRFQVLRVLDLEGCDLSESGDDNLKCVGNLSYLRYLGLKDTELSKIPREIGQLLFLQILDLRGVDAEVPASIVGLTDLICLYLEPYSDLPEGFRNLTSLQELTGVTIYGNQLEELGYLINLRVVDIKLAPECKDAILVLLESICKLHRVESLEIFWYSGKGGRVSMDLIQGWVPSEHLRRLWFAGWFGTLPAWISSSSLSLLSYLIINVLEARPEHIQILGTLPALRYVYLESVCNTDMEGRTMERFVLSSDAFPCARQCKFSGVTLVLPLIFSQGAMPKVQSLRFGLLVSNILSAGDQFDLSLRNLPALEEVSIDLQGEQPGNLRYMNARDVVARAGDNHPNNPKVFL